MTPKLKKKIQAYIKDVQMLEDGNIDLALEFFTDANNLLWEIKEEFDKQNLRKDLEEIMNVLDNIIGYHNKNLTKYQDENLCFCAEKLDNIIKEVF